MRHVLYHHLVTNCCALHLLYQLLCAAPSLSTVVRCTFFINCCALHLLYQLLCAAPSLSIVVRCTFFINCCALHLLYQLMSVSAPTHFVGRDSSVGIATRYGLDGLGIEYRWGANFPRPSRPTLEHTQPPIQWVPSFPGGKAADAWR